MDKFERFYIKMNEDEELRAEVSEILGGSGFEKASDEQLLKIGKAAEKVGFDFSLEEVKSHFSEEELDDESLDAVAGGKGTKNYGSKNVMKTNIN